YNPSSIVYVTQQASKTLDSNMTPLRGSHSTKFETILKRIQWILKKSPSTASLSSTLPAAIASSASIPPDKMIVFSEWNEALDMLCAALEENAMDYIRYNGSRQDFSALTMFLTDPHYRILVCNIHKAGKGITMTAANHILFIEPCLRVADEQQAIARIYRMGQTKQTYVWRFIVKKSVEEKIIEMTKHRKRLYTEKESVLSDEIELEKEHITIDDIRILFDLRAPSAEEVFPAAAAIN
ncbi:SNF2 family N-terminal domain-containing protein, partial [Cardiosporidium cionae]